MTHERQTGRADERDAEDPPRTFTVVTWNLQGSHGVDVDEVANALMKRDADLVALQEVHRRQALDIAERLGWNIRWAFKHFPLVTRPEGLALLSPHPLSNVDVVLLRRALPTSWRRRIALVARCEEPSGAVQATCVHLSPHDDAGARRRELRILLDHLARRTRPDTDLQVIVGDLNTVAPGDLDAALTDDGWHDCWSGAPRERRRGHGATNWSPGPRAGRRPDQRLDYVYAKPEPSVSLASVPTEASDTFALLSDHIPLTVEFMVKVPT